MLVRPEGRTLRALQPGLRKSPQVSMLVRPEGRTLLTSPLSVNRLTCCFNARPPRRTDATRVFNVRVEFQRDSVSMLVRPEGRTLRETCGCWFLRIHRFNARPPRRTDATPSRPPPTGLPRCFNARPPRRTDATQRRIARILRDAKPVSMLVRPEGRTLQRHSTKRTEPEKFQCSSAPKDGRYQIP